METEFQLIFVLSLHKDARYEQELYGKNNMLTAVNEFS